VDKLKRLAFRLRSTAARALLACCVLPIAACSVAHDASLSHAETRTPIELSAKEREHMRAGMRAYLEAVDGITTALGENRMPEVAKSAKAVGTDEGCRSETAHRDSGQLHGLQFRLPVCPVKRILGSARPQRGAILSRPRKAMNSSMPRGREIS
jgi:hypothetical protein